MTMKMCLSSSAQETWPFLGIYRHHNLDLSRSSRRSLVGTRRRIHWRDHSCRSCPARSQARRKAGRGRERGYTWAWDQERADMGAGRQGEYISPVPSIQEKQRLRYASSNSLQPAPISPTFRRLQNGYKIGLLISGYSIKVRGCLSKFHCCISLNRS